MPCVGPENDSLERADQVVIIDRDGRAGQPSPARSSRAPSAWGAAVSSIASASPVDRWRAALTRAFDDIGAHEAALGERLRLAERSGIARVSIIRYKRIDKVDRLITSLDCALA